MMNSIKASIIKSVKSLQVSWIRLSDLNLLTVGRYTYTSDLRFEAEHEKNSMDWNLVLQNARLSDSGISFRASVKENEGKC